MADRHVSVIAGNPVHVGIIGEGSAVELCKITDSLMDFRDGLVVGRLGHIENQFI